MIELKASYFDGKTSGARNVTVQLSQKSILIQGGVDVQIPREQLRILNPMQNCPLIIEIKDGARLEIDPRDYSYDQIKSFAGSRNRLVYWLETNLISVLVSAFLIIVGAVYVVQVVLPRFSVVIAEKVPQSWANALDNTIVEQLDGRLLAPTVLPMARQQELLKFLRQKINTPPKILFRKLQMPNAFALAGNTMIISDELVETMDQDEEILAVALHEMAHLKKRHVLSMLISSSALSALAFVVIGDMVGTTEWILNIGVFLVGAKYSRSFEKEADAWALASLEALHLPASCFKEALLHLEKAYSSKVFKQSTLLNYLSSHPGIDERVGKIKGEACEQRAPEEQNL